MFDFTVRPDSGEPFAVVATSRDVVAWEKSSRGRTFADLQRPQMADFYALAHLAAKRLGLTDLNRADFESSCDIDIEDMAEPDPTPPAP